MKKSLEIFKDKIEVFTHALQSEGKGYCESRYLEVVAELLLAGVELLGSIRRILILAGCVAGLEIVVGGKKEERDG